MCLGTEGNIPKLYRPVVSFLDLKLQRGNFCRGTK